MGIVAIVGRPNVGKSTLFNRLTESRDAIVYEQSGTTRDRHYGKVLWSDVEFTVIDTGGYVRNSEDIFEGEIRRQVQFAIEEADVILFIVDLRLGITDLDDSVADMLRRSGKKVIVVANKTDTPDLTSDSYQFHAFGLGDLFAISAINGSGTGDLLDAIVAAIPAKKVSDELDELPRFAVVGRPNVGKSSFINALIGEERNIVTPIAGTTRDSTDTHYNKFGHDFVIVDTAGIRKKGKVHEDVEFYSVLRAIRTIEKADVCFLLIDATLGMEMQDVNIFQLIESNRKGVVILVNKWDLIDEKSNKLTNEAIARIKDRIAPFDDVPILFISALSKQRVYKALETAMEVYQNRRKRITTSKLNDVMLAEIEHHQPPIVKDKAVRIKYVTQLPTPTPSFAFFCNHPQYVREPYMRFLENRIREHFGFAGVPIQIYMRSKS